MKQRGQEALVAGQRLLILLRGGVKVAGRLMQAA